ncbi:unnamed protein product [Discosporangium mesarthrocarpum]
MAWEKPKCMGDVPAKRSGHSFTVVGSMGYLFGGVPQKRPPGPTNDLFKLDMSNAGEFYWQKVKPPPSSGSGQKWPAPRWFHSASVYAKTNLVVFGGFFSSGVRFNDLWILDTSNGDRWSQPQPGQTDEGEDGVWMRI